MTDNHRTTGQQNSQSQPLVSIYWDYQNLSDYKRAKDLLLFASGLGCVVNRKVYNYWEKQNKEAKETLRCLDFEFVHEPVKITGAVDFNLFGECYSEASSSLYPHIYYCVWRRLR